MSGREGKQTLVQMSAPATSSPTPAPGKRTLSGAIAPRRFCIPPVSQGQLGGGFVETIDSASVLAAVEGFSWPTPMRYGGVWPEGWADLQFCCGLEFLSANLVSLTHGKKSFSLPPYRHGPILFSPWIELKATAIGWEYLGEGPALASQSRGGGSLSDAYAHSSTDSSKLTASIGPKSASVGGEASSAETDSDTHGSTSLGESTLTATSPTSHRFRVTLQLIVKIDVRPTSENVYGDMLMASATPLLGAGAEAPGIAALGEGWRELKVAVLYIPSEIMFPAERCRLL